MPPTATETLTSAQNFSKLSLKASSPADSVPATLHSLYPRAVKAFLKRDVALTYTLLTSAFSLIGAPATVQDELSEHRLKWDLLRITLETTVYSSPPLSEDPEAFPTALRANQMLTPQSLVNNLYSRSLQLFTPQHQSHKPNATYLPPKILVTLIPASVKLGCPSVGRGMIEEWLARRPQDSSPEGREYYWKVLNYYCLEILPRLEEWDYAADFLQYEQELDTGLRNNMSQALRDLHQQALMDRSVTPNPKVEPLRSPSPTPSTSSDSSSYTATPRSPNPNKVRSKGKPHATNGTGRRTHTPSPSSSLSVASAATSRTVTPASVNRSHSHTRQEPNEAHGNSAMLKNTPRTSRVASGSLSPIPRNAVSSPTLQAPSTLVLIRSYIQHLIRTAAKSKLAAFILLFVVIPMASFVFRARRRITNGAGHSGAAEEVRRRLRTAQAGVGGTTLLGKFWEETLRAIMDTVMMGGRGLV